MSRGGRYRPPLRVGPRETGDGRMVATIIGGQAAGGDSGAGAAAGREDKGTITLGAGRGRGLRRGAWSSGRRPG